MFNQTGNSGTAALSICEALLLAMNDHMLLPEREIVGVLRGAAAAHENAVGSEKRNANAPGRRQPDK